MRVVLILLCLVAAAIYVQTLFPIGGHSGAEDAQMAASAPAVQEVNSGLRAVPESQLLIIRDVFAPEIQ